MSANPSAEEKELQSQLASGGAADDPYFEIRHSCAHVLAAALKRLFPGTRLGIGPPVEDGFYYDVQPPRPLTAEDLPTIEAEMKKIVAEGQTFERTVLPIAEAKRFFAERDEPFKVEIIETIAAQGDETVSLYRNGEFVDLCRGRHVQNTREIAALKLMSLAGAYWRGNENNPQLTRVYGTAWRTPDELAAYLHRLEEAEKRDHRKLGRELELFSIQEDVGGGLIFWHPKLAIVRHVIETYWKEEHLKRGYQFVYTPHIANERLYQISGHLENYGELMYNAMDIDGQPYRVKPMNCPGHIMIFRSRKRSYRELPMRLAELGTVYRYERSGVLHGMLRVRGFTVDDSHIFCTEEQTSSEVENCLELLQKMMTDFGYTYKCYLATRPESHTIGTDEGWKRSTEALKSALERRGLPFEVDAGGGAFYGPKIDVKLMDAIGRLWQGPTIQVDMGLPERFDITYVGADGREHRPVMVHRAILGSFERFVGGLIEHYAGVFPLWLAPEQVRVLNVSEGSLPYARQVAAELRQGGLRVGTDDGSDKVGAKIRRAETDKVPYMLVVGERDAAAGTVSPRRHGKGVEEALSASAFLERALAEVREKR
jgi:threonyl-tRNA synthetase